MYYSLNENSKYSEIEVDRILTHILLNFEIPAKNQGFFFIKECVKIAYFNPLSRFNLNESILKIVAKKYNSTSSRIDRSIRHAISMMSAQNNLNSFKNIFCIKNNFSIIHPSVGEFISLLAESINFINPKFLISFEQ